MHHRTQTLPLEAHVRAAWQTQLAAAVHTPGLLPTLVRRQPELLPRFAAYYTHLRALPRRVRRALQRQWRLPLAGVALLLALGQSPGLAATIPVGGTCTLVDALTAANTDTATGGCPAGSGADTLVLPAGSTQTLTAVNNETYGPTGLPVVSSVITIAGNGSTIVRESSAPEFRLLAVRSTGELTLQETTVSGGVAPVSAPPGFLYVFGVGVANYGGTLTITNSTISGNASYFGAGGVLNSGGTFTLTSSTISDNFSEYGSGGVWNRYGTVTITNSTISGNRGGGVANIRGTVTITNSTISGNSAVNEQGGGGVANYGGTLTITNSTISENSSVDESGGGVRNNSGIVMITNSTISDNGSDSDGSAGLGGGVVNEGGGTLIMTNSTVSGNRADYDGGGVVNDGGTLIMTNSTVSGNRADYGGGGGVVNDGGTLIMTNSTISGNRADYGGGGVSNSGTLRLVRTLVAGNTAPTGPEIVNSGTTLADNHNLFGVDGTAGVEGFLPGVTDIVPPAGVLLPDILNPTLAFNGGPTQTHALVPGSPAIDAGGTDCTDVNGNPLPTDQRGKPRLVDGDGNGTAACDIGAFEFFPIVNAFVTLDPALDTAFDPTPVPGGPAGTFTITATFTNTSGTPLRFLFFTVTALSGDNLVLNADAGTQDVGATVTPEVGDDVLTPGETMVVDFVIGLHAREPFTFLVNLFGEPVH
jgi:hypothetical protein